MSKPDNMERAGRLFETFVIAVMQDTGFSKQDACRFLAASAAGFSRGAGRTWQEFEASARIGWGTAKSAGDA